MNISNSISTVILCGGRSRRMGRDKAKLNRGKAESMTFLGGLIASLSSIEDLWLSIGSGECYPEYHVRKISDRFPDCGPLAGLEAALTVCRHEAIFVAPVDMPFVDYELAAELYNIYYKEKNVDALLVTDGQGRKQHLLGIYRKSLLPRLTGILEAAALNNNNYINESDQGSPSPDNIPGQKIKKNKRLKMADFLDEIKVRYIPAGQLTDGIRKTATCNTVEEYKQLIALGKEGPVYDSRAAIPVLSFTGWSGSGKTTFLERLIPCLTARGIRVACLKHDAHHFEIDKEGKDSWRLTRAGASMTGLFSEDRGVWMENRPVGMDLMLAHVHDVDLIILEGGSMTSYPRILVYRESLGKGLRVDPRQCLAVISDDPVPGAIRQFSFRDPEGAADYILTCL